MNELLAMRVAALGSALLHFLWQGALIGLLAWLTLLLMRHEKPQARYAVACLALLSCLLLPSWQVARLFLGETVAVAAHAGTGVAGPADRDPAPAAMPSATAFLAAAVLPSAPDPLLRFIVGFWALGAGLLSARLACGLVWVERLRASAIPGADTERWQATVDRLAQRFGLRRAVALRLIAEGESPLSAGWLKPVVLLPVALALRLPYPLLEALLAHELAHIRRHDYLVNLLQAAVEVVLFYHPVVWWLSRRIREEREQVADALAAGVLGEGRRLALALFELDAIHAPVPAFAQAAQGGHLMSRIQKLIRPQHRNLGTGVVLPLFVLPVFVLTVAGLAFYANAQPGPRAAAAEKSDGAGVQGRLHIHGNGEGSSEGYALVRRDRERFSMSGDLDDVDAIRDVRRKIDSDFLWFRRGKETFIVRDAALLARAEAAWQPTEELDQRMQALNEQMEPHRLKMEAIGERMERLTPSEKEEARIAEASKAVESLADQLDDLASEHQSLAREHRRAEGEMQGEKLAEQMEALSQRQEKLSRLMEERSTALEALTDRIEVQHQPMEQLAREMEAASKPMEELGKKMEVVGKEIEQKAKAADKEIWSVIDEATKKGLATSAKEIR